LGRPGRAPRAISSILGWVAAVNETDSPSQDKPQLIQRIWIGLSPSRVVGVALGGNVTMILYFTSDLRPPSWVVILLG
jgi:hypothetical protein